MDPERILSTEKMSLSNIHTRVQQVKMNYETLIKNHESDVVRLNELGEQITKIREEQALLETSKTVMDEAKKILTKTSLEYCERLATVAVKTIFNLPAAVKYSSTDGKFYLAFDDGMVSDIAGDEGGGIKTVISFVFSLYLVIKSNSRRVMFFDEAWTQVSAEYFPAFIAFVKQICVELGFEILLVTHDERITLNDVDTAYFMEKGVCKRIK